MKFSQRVRDVISFSMSLGINRKYHFTDRPIEKIKNSRFVTDPKNLKPIGLWYSWGGAWPLYLLSEYARGGGCGRECEWVMCRLNLTRLIYEIDIDLSNVLKIRTKKDFRQFCQRYGELSSEAKSLHYNSPFEIKWDDVKNDYYGIDIKYNEDMSVDHFWYHRWDCHSGCIWNKRAIRGHKQVWIASS